MHDKYQFISLSLYSLLFIEKCVFQNNKETAEARIQTQGFGSSGQVQGPGFALGHKDIVTCHWEVSDHKELDSATSACWVHPLQGQLA